MLKQLESEKWTFNYEELKSVALKQVEDANQQRSLLKVAKGARKRAREAFEEAEMATAAAAALYVPQSQVVISPSTSAQSTGTLPQTSSSMATAAQSIETQLQVSTLLANPPENLSLSTSDLNIPEISSPIALSPICSSTPAKQTSNVAKKTRVLSKPAAKVPINQATAESMMESIEAVVPRRTNRRIVSTLKR